MLMIRLAWRARSVSEWPSFVREQASFADAARRARERRSAAIPAVYAAECDHMEQQAEAMEVEASRLEAESNALRAQLESHDDWGYFPAEGQVDGKFVAASHTVPVLARVVTSEPWTREVRGSHVFAVRPRRCGRRRRRCDSRKHTTPDRLGSSVEDIISEVHADPMRIAPSAQEILTWIESSNDQAVSTTEKLFIKLEWKAGIIDRQQSRVSRLQRAAGMVADTGSTGSAIDAVLGEPAGAEEVA